METIGFRMMQEVTIDRLGPSGDGYAGGLRVPLTLPGEVARGEVSDAGMVVAELLEASPERVAPPCRHFGTCGGCALQHASDGFLADWKRGIVVQALERRGLSAAFRPVQTSPARSRRRAVFGGQRTRQTGTVGFHGRRSGTLVEISECALIRPEILAAKPVLEALTGAGATRGGTIRLSVTSGPAGLDIDATEARALDGPLSITLAGLAEEGDLARLTWNGETLSLRRPPFQPMGKAQVVPPPGAFLQATAEGALALTEAAREAVGKARRIADLFAGCGTLSLPLAERAEVRAVEGESAMLAALDLAARRTPGLRPVKTERRDLFRRPLLPLELKGFDAVVIDPPRAGAEVQSRRLAESAVKRIAMISCDPVSFARDAAILTAGGYRLDWVQVVDQFRWSAHVELAALFLRD